jgi:phosphate transport system substrate-binding protein
MLANKCLLLLYGPLILPSARREREEQGGILFKMDAPARGSILTSLLCCGRKSGASQGYRLHSSLILLPLLALLLVGCNDVSGGAGVNVPANPSHLLIASSPTLLPLIRTAAVLFARQHPEAQIAVQSSESSAGLNALAHRQADIAATVLYEDPSTFPAAKLFEQILCVVPFLIIVHPGIPLASLSQEQLLRIFSTGEITNWKQIGGPNQRIVVLLPSSTSDIRSVFREEVLGGAPEVGTVLPTDSLETLDGIVARTPGGISYLPAPLVDARVHRVAIDGEEATVDRIASGHYVFWSFAHLYTWDSAAPDREEISEGGGIGEIFLHFLQTSAAKLLIQQFGYIPLSQMAL